MDWREWLSYLVTTFFLPWGHSLEGVVHWQGQEGATGSLRISDNHLEEEQALPDDDVDAEVRSWMKTLESADLGMRSVAANELARAAYVGDELQREVVAARSKALDPPEVAKVALETLGELGEVAASVVPLVGPLLRSPDPQLRYWATFALGRLGPGARVALPELERLTTDPEYGPKYGAIDAIQRLSVRGT